jgi:NADH/NAD ratio-sensing transcriptional regulator Rex
MNKQAVIGEEHEIRDSPNTVERLSLYRRLLEAWLEKGTTHLYSHEIAAMACVTPAQVRRDLMAIGYNGSPSRGYSVDALEDSIGRSWEATPSGR